jgi:hypothetical protein
MAQRTTPAAFVVAVLLGAALSGCGPEFDPQAKIASLRVIAVQKDRPYAQPGDEVNLEMLWSDGSEDAGRPVEIAWVGGCHNPLGDLYQGCFATPDAMLEPGTGDTFTLSIPDDIITSRPPPPDPQQPPYGLSYVFFAACAGSFDRASGGGGFSLICRDSAGNELGSDDFVAGYTAIYTYDSYRNGNPIVRGLSLDGKPLSGGCFDPGSAAAAESGDLGAVLGRAAEGTSSGSPSEPPTVCDSTEIPDPQDQPDCSLPDAPCITAPPPGDFLREALEIRPEVYRASIEPDEISRDAYGRDYEEQMWINYYISRGELRSDVRLLNDATTGLNEEFSTFFYPSHDPGPITIWAVVHDNRGGTAWARGTLWVQPFVP